MQVVLYLKLMDQEVEWIMLFLYQVPGSTHYSMVFYFVTRELVPGSLLHRFVDGDDEFRNSRLKLIPSVPKVSIFLHCVWINA